MALHFAHRVRFLPRRHHLNLILSARRCIHQEFIHPHDVPAYQTPTLGEGKYKGKEIDESQWGMRENNLNFRSDEINLKSEFEGQDYPTWIWAQDPEQFLPDEQGFWEFWGHYPFVFFGAAALVSKEYWLSYASYPSHGGWIVLPIATTLVLSFGDFRERLSHSRAQFRLDRDWLGMRMLRKSLSGLIGSYENDLKTKERSTQYDDYLEALNRRKVAFYAHLRQKEFARDVLRRLKVVRQAEETYEKNIKAELVTEAISSVQKKIVEDGTWQKQWDTNMFKALKALRSGQEVDADDTTRLLFQDFLRDKSKRIEEEVDKSRPMDSVTRTLFDSILRNTRDLKVYDGPTEIPKEFVPRTTGIYGPLSEKQQKSLIPSEAHLKEQKLKVIDQQLSRFKPDTIPQALVDLQRRVEAVEPV